MATTNTGILQAPLATQYTGKGPVTLARQRRTLLIYAGVCLLGATPLLVGAPAGWQAAGLGLWAPGAGFLAVGGLAVLLFPLVAALFALSLVAWFWAGAVLAPLTVWLGSAALAGGLAGPSTWAPAPLVAALAVVATAFAFRRRNQRAALRGRERAAARASFLPTSLPEVRAQVGARPDPGQRELDADDLASLRYLFDRALQPRGRWDGFTVIDQFQPAALRYQLNHMGFALGLAQTHYLPNFTGYLAQAQRNLIERYLERKVWGYWVWESCWGHLNFTHWDPADRDNIMLTGWYGMHVGQYMLASGDRRYAEPGALSFRLNDKTTYVHDFHTIVESVVKNLDRAPFCLYPCEPNWVYPICNHYGMAALAAHDRLYGTTYVADHLLPWLEKLDTEFTDESGTIIGLRSELTGIEFPFPTGEAGYACFANCFVPERAQRMWAVARRELGGLVRKDDAGRAYVALPTQGIDAGSYRRGNTHAYATILTAAREFGEDEIAEAALRSLETECGLATDGGVRRYARGSNLANALAVQGRIQRTGDFRASFVEGPPPATATGPVLAEARYPDVLVAKARSIDGRGLELVLHGHGREAIRLERLAPGAAYTLAGFGASTPFRADHEGQAKLEVELRGHTSLHVAPEA